MLINNNLPEGLLNSMALRYDHSFNIKMYKLKDGILEYETDKEFEERRKNIISKMELIYFSIPDEEYPLSKKMSSKIFKLMKEKYKEIEKEQSFKDSYLITILTQLYEEISGNGFYSFK